MPEPTRRHFKVEALPADLLAEVERLTLAGIPYPAITAHLSGLGHDFTKSSVSRYGRHLLQHQHAIEAATQAAKDFLTIGHDVSLERFASQLAISKIVDVLMTVNLVYDEEMSLGDLTALMRGVAALQAASLARQKWAAEIALRAALAADEVAQVASRGGLSDTVVEDIRRRVLGISGDAP